MNRVKASLTNGIAALLAALLARPPVADDITEPVYITDDAGLDFNEQTHLEFMCVE